MKPRIDIILDRAQHRNHTRFRVDANDESVYLTYAELVIFGMLAIWRHQNIQEGWIGIDEFGTASGNTRSHLWRIVKRFRAFETLSDWDVYESDHRGNIRLLTYRGKIKINYDGLAELDDHRLRVPIRMSGL